MATRNSLPYDELHPPKTGGGRTLAQVQADAAAKAAYNAAKAQYDKQIAKQQSAWERQQSQYASQKAQLDKAVAAQKKANADIAAQNAASSAQAKAYAKVHPNRPQERIVEGPGMGFGGPHQRTSSVRGVRPGLKPRRRL